MKRLLCCLSLVALTWGSVTPTRAQQYECVTPAPAKSTSVKPSPAPSPTTPPVEEDAPLIRTCYAPSVYYVRVNVHYMLKSDGTGNFTENDDQGSHFAMDWDQAGPNGSALPYVNGSLNYNGYKFAEDIVSFATTQLANNQQMELPLGNTTPVLPPRIAYVLGGVYFHRDSDLYNYNQLGPDYYTAPDAVLSPAQFNAYGANKNKEINVFLMGQSTNETIRPGGANFYRWAYLSGGANTFGYSAGNNWVKLGNVWRVHLLARANNNGVDANGASAIGRVLNHEIGHKLNLFHPFDGDNCADTPQNLNPDGTPNAGAGNNLMDYGNQVAVTPCQIDIMQSALRSDYAAYYACGDCQAPNAFFTLPSVYINGPNTYSGCLTMDAQGSYQETDYALSISQVDANNQIISTLYRVNGLGQAGTYCLSNQFNFQRNTRYAVTLTVNNQCTSSTLTKYVETRDSNVLYERQAAPKDEPAREQVTTLYPNPATSAGFTLHSTLPLEEVPVVRDSQGRTIAVEPAGQVQDETGWHTTYRLGARQSKNSLYLVEVLVNGKRTVHRLSVQAE